MLTEQEIFAALAAMPEPQPVFYRLYHDNQGLPLFYSMEDLPGNYIEIDAAAFAQSSMNVQVQNGRLVQRTRWFISKLEPTESGTPCHPDDVAIVVDPDQPHQCWSKQTYEKN